MEPSARSGAGAQLGVLLEPDEVGESPELDGQVLNDVVDGNDACPRERRLGAGVVRVLSWQLQRLTTTG